MKEKSSILYGQQSNEVTPHIVLSRRAFVKTTGVFLLGMTLTQCDGNSTVEPTKPSDPFHGIPKPYLSCRFETVGEIVATPSEDEPGMALVRLYPDIIFENQGFVASNVAYVDYYFGQGEVNTPSFEMERKRREIISLQAGEMIRNEYFNRTLGEAGIAVAVLYDPILDPCPVPPIEIMRSSQEDRHVAYVHAFPMD